MKTSTVEWIEKAEGDWKVALRVYRARKDPVYDAVCYHCHQCAEKYLKAKLNEATLAIPKTHNLRDLLKLVLPVEKGWSVLRPHLTALNRYAVLFRYPGRNATKAQMQKAIKDCREVRRIIRTAFGLPI